MILQELELANFKNYASAKLVLNTGVNLFYGINGSGKTNLLDAIYYTALSKSYFHLSDKYLVRDGEEFLRVVSLFQNGEKEKSKVVVKYKLGSKKIIELNKRILKSASEIVGRIPIVFVAPDDIKLVKDSSKERRDFVNRILCQSDRTYLKKLMVYNRVLSQKNALLKNEYRPDRLLIQGYNKVLAENGKYIFEQRQKFSNVFALKLSELYRSISINSEEVAIKYESQLEGEEVLAMFEQIMQEEINRRRPLAGIQKDDFVMTIEGKSLKKFGSQGQIKSYLYALRMAEYDYLKSVLNEKPILILDDFFEKLDKNRLAALLKLINSDTFDQVFLSDTELERSESLFKENDINYSAYHIENGVVETL